ncbi:ZN271 protein, partial [Polyodon spathula]|nr:ZN271 protein [Polyodon spathula]
MEAHQSFHRLVQEGSPGTGEVGGALSQGGPTGRLVVVTEESDRELSGEGETVLEEEGWKVSQTGLGYSEGCEHVERQGGEGVIGEGPGVHCELEKGGGGREGLPCVRNEKLRELRQGGAAERYAEESETARHTDRGRLGPGLREGLRERLGGGMTDIGLFSKRHQKGNQNQLTGSTERLERPRVDPTEEILSVQALRARLWNIVEQCSDMSSCRGQLREFWRGFTESRTCEGGVNERQGVFWEQGCTKKNASAGCINRLEGSRAGYGPEVRDSNSSLGYSQSRNSNGVQSVQNVLDPASCQRFTEKRLGPESTTRGLPHQNVLEAGSRNGGFQNGLEHSRYILKEGSGCSAEEVLECSRSGMAPKQVGSLSRACSGNRDFMERIRDILENSPDGKMCRERLESFWKSFGEQTEGREREHWGEGRGNETATEREGDGQNRAGNGKQGGREWEERRRERKNRLQKKWRENREECTRTEQIGTDRNAQRLKAGLERDREETAETRTAPSNRKTEAHTPRITENQPPRAAEQERGERAEGGLMDLEPKGTSLKEERGQVPARGILEYNRKVSPVPERGSLEEEERIGRDLRELELNRGSLEKVRDPVPISANLEEYREVEKEEHSQNLTLQRAGSDAEGRTRRDLVPARGTASLNLPYKCGLCPASFPRPSEAKAHVQGHSPGRPYPCPHCPRRFRRRFDVLRHGRVHSGEKPFACAVCQRRFSQAGTLRTHSLVHSQDKPHRCSLCPASFRRSADLRLHQRRHSGDKRYPCSLCDKAFVQSNALLAHQQTHYRRERRRQCREQETERH